MVRHVDGDTIVVRALGPGEPLKSSAQVPVRLVQIDAPETKHPSRAVQCWGAEATAALPQLVPVGSVVELERDRELRDRYGR
jgi:micrococcal nuclease